MNFTKESEIYEWPIITWKKVSIISIGTANENHRDYQHIATRTAVTEQKTQVVTKAMENVEPAVGDGEVLSGKLLWKEFGYF